MSDEFKPPPPVPPEFLEWMEWMRRQAKIDALCDVSTLIRETPARCSVHHPLWFNTPTTAAELHERGDRYGRSVRDVVSLVTTRCVLHRYHDGACSFSVLGVGLEGVE